MSIILYGDFTDLLSLVASLRADTLIAAGAEIEWRAVVRTPTTTITAAPRSQEGRRELTQAAQRWREVSPTGESIEAPGPGFVPNAAAAAAGYAEAVGAGVGDHVRYLLFSSYWRAHLDIGNPDQLRRLLTVPILHGHSDSDVLREYGYAVSIAGGPVTSSAWRLRNCWEKGWRAVDRRALPAVVEGADVHIGSDAIRRLGALGDAPQTIPHGNPYPLPPMRVAARRLDLARPRGRAIWRDG